MTVARWRGAVVAALIVGACGSSRHAPKDAGGSLPDADAPDTLLGHVAAIVIPNCAVAGCHDAVSKTHSMDLSTPDKIVSAWVDQRGFDHCTGLDTPRVIPGDPAGSLVVMKIEGIAVCLQSQRMPLPPRDALTAEQIEVIRAWIAAGAPSDRPPSDGGASDDAAPDAGGFGSACTTASPCGPELTCAGDAERGFTGAVRCSDPAPVCPEGQAPSVVNDCYGPCIPVASCRCAAHYMCPSLTLYTCLADARCGPNPRLDAGADTDGP